MADYVPEKVHLVGSIGLDSVEEIYRTVGGMFGRRLRRVPDGEVGPRRLWVTFQYPLLRSSPFLQRDPGGALRKTSGGGAPFGIGSIPLAQSLPEQS